MAGEQHQSSDPRPSTVVVTSENLAEFHAQKLGIEAPTKPGDQKPEAKPAGEQKAEGEQGKAKPGEGEEALEEERKAEKDPKKQRLNLRFSELTGQRNTAVNERDAAREEAKREREARLALEAKLNGADKGEAKGDEANRLPPADADKKPERAKFKAGAEGDAEYQDAVIDWRADQRIAQREREAEERRAGERQEGVKKAWKENVQAIRAVIPDFDAKIGAATVVLSNQVTDALVAMKGEAGPRCLYYFAEFPQEAERIGKLSVGDALVELGEIRAKVMSGKAAPKEEKGEEKGDADVSKAPKPAVPLKSHAAPEALTDEKGELRPGLSFKEYKEARKDGKIK